MTATATPEEQLVQAPESVTLFVSRRENLRLTKVQRYPIRGAAGQQVGETPGEVVVFRNHELRVPHEGTMRLEDDREIDAAEIREWLEQHRRHNDREDGFWVVQMAAPPIGADELKVLMDLVLKLDEDGLVTFVEQEEKGWNRAELIEAAMSSLEQVQAVKAAAKTE